MSCRTAASLGEASRRQLGQHGVYASASLTHNRSDARAPLPCPMDRRGVSRHLIHRPRCKPFAVAYVYFESEPGRRAAANLMTKDEARKIAAGIAKLPKRDAK
jgi:hypothetical protein